MHAANKHTQSRGLEIIFKAAIVLAIAIMLVVLASGSWSRTAQAVTSEMRGAEVFQTGQALPAVFTAPPRPGSFSSLALADPVGSHDGNEGSVSSSFCGAFGWVFDPDDPDRDLTVQILADSTPVITTTADLLREDLIEICGDGTCGFGVNLWGLITAGDEHQIRAQAYDQDSEGWFDIGGTPKALTCWGFPEGSHDGNSGEVPSSSCGASGWVYDPDDPERDLTVEVLSDGTPVISTTANLLREGIDPAICPEGTCGFGASLWGLITPGEEHQISIRLNDEETGLPIFLDDEPLPLTCWGFPEGHHDGESGEVPSSSCAASGWTFDPDNPERDLTVQILSDGTPVISTTANLLREGIDPAICPEGTCGFGVGLWGLITPGVEHQILPQVFDDETESWVDLNEEPMPLTCWGYPEGNHDTPEGQVDYTMCAASGWVFDPDDPEREMTVRIFSDDTLVVTTTADRLREDINPLICPEGTCGFYASLWGLISPREEHQIRVEVYDEETESQVSLDEEPRPLTCWGFDLFLPGISR